MNKYSNMDAYMPEDVEYLNRLYNFGNMNQKQNNTIMQNNSIACPMSGKRIAFYSKTGEKLQYILPERTKPCAARKLYDNGPQTCEVDFQDGIITVQCDSNVPIIVEYTEE